MKLLTTSQWVLSLVFIIPFEKPLKKWKKNIYFVAGAFGVICLTIGFFSSVIAFINAVSIDLKAALYPLAQIASLGSSLNIILVVFFLRHKIAPIFARLSEIYKICK